MKFDVIQTLQLACNGFTDPQMEAAYIQTPEVSQAERLMMDAIAAGNLAELDELCADAGCERENQGFINGFRMGSRMMAECGFAPSVGSCGSVEQENAARVPTPAPVAKAAESAGNEAYTLFLNAVKSDAEDVRAGFGTVGSVVGAVDDYIYHNFRLVDLEMWPKKHVDYLSKNLQSLMVVVTHLLAEMEERQDKLVTMICQEVWKNREQAAPTQSRDAEAQDLDTAS